MIDFHHVALAEEATPFAMPAVESHYLTKRMREADIRLEYYSWRDVVLGRAPLSYEEALDTLRPFEEADAFCAAPCVIVSRVAPEDMLEKALCMVREPIDPDYSFFANAHAAMKGVVLKEQDKQKYPGATRSDFLDRPSEFASDTLDSWNRSYIPDGPRVLRRTDEIWSWRTSGVDPRAARLSMALVQSAADGTLVEQCTGPALLKTDPHAEDEVTWLLALLLEDREFPTYTDLDEMLDEALIGHDASGFSSKEQAVFVLEEAVASLSLEIATWVEAPRRGKLAQAFFEVDPCNYAYPENLQFEGIVGNINESNVLHMRTPSVRLILERIDGVPFGFVITSIKPDFATPSAQPTGINLRAKARAILKKQKSESRWVDSIDCAVKEYRCDSGNTVGIRHGRYWFSDQDDAHFAAVDVPSSNPAVSQTVYVDYLDGVHLVTCAGAAPGQFVYYPMSSWGYSSASVNDEGICFFSKSDGPNLLLYDSRVRLEDPGMFEAFKWAHPDIAEVVDDLCRTVAFYEGSESADLWRPYMSINEWRRIMAKKLPRSWWDKPDEPLDFLAGKSALLAIASGQDCAGE